MTNDPSHRRGRISRAQIVDAAIALVEQDGIGKLTMRNVAQVLHVEPMSLYHHIDGKAALLAAMADRSLSQLPASAPGLRWDARLVDLMVQTYRVGHANPVLVEILASPAEVILTLPEVGSAAPLGLMERVLELLEESGLAVPDRIPVYRGLIGLVVGFMVAGTARPVTAPHVVVGEGRAGLGARLASFRPLLDATDPEPDLRLNLRRLLDGFTVATPPEAVAGPVSDPGTHKR